MLGDFQPDGDHIITPAIKLIDFGGGLPGLDDRPNDPATENLKDIAVVSTYLPM